MPRKKPLLAPPTNKRIKPPGSPFHFSPLKDKTQNNELEFKTEENGFPKAEEKGEAKMERQDICKYLHKKFKKVATLEEASTPSPKGFPFLPTATGQESEGAGTPTNDSSSPSSPTSGGRYLCPYCKLSCSKPSVLQKHIRAHTNERPFPCHPCGFAFKTKSNLYKHCRSRAHTLKMDESDGANFNLPNAPATYLMDSGSTSEEDDLMRSASDFPPLRPPSSDTKRIYKPKFHTSPSPSFSNQSDSEISPSKGLTLTIPPPPSSFNPSPQSTPSPFTSSSSPSPELLNRHINKIISENQAILEPSGNNHPWGKKVRQGRECPSLSLALPKNGDSDIAKSSKLAFALLWPEKQPHPTRGDAQAQPSVLDLSTPKVDLRRRPLTSDNILRKITDLRPNLSIKFTEPPEDSQKTEEYNSSSHQLRLNSKDLNLNITKKIEDVDMYYYSCPICKDVFRSTETLEVHFQECNDNAQKKSQHNETTRTQATEGPLLGNTPLIEYPLSNEQILAKKRKLDPSLSPRIGAMPNTAKTVVNLCGGEVMVLDRPEEEETKKKARTTAGSLDLVDAPSKQFEPQVLTISKTGLHSVRGTMIQTPQPERTSPKPSPHPYPEKVVLPVVQPKVTLGVQGVQGVPPPTVHLPFSPALNPLTSITGFNPLTLPPSAPPSGGEGGENLVTILYGGKQIPFVPGIPGPNSLLAQQPLIPQKPRPAPEKASVIVKAGPPISPSPVSCAKINVPTIQVEENPLEITPSHTLDEPMDFCGSEQVEKKFLRPSSLPLKPGTYTPKKLLPLSQQVSLVSPETPRPRKSYGQLYLNGHAYTYLGLKCSTRPFFCTLNKPQPMYVPLSPDHNKVSMYSNWAICSEVNPHPLGLEARKALSYYDSRGRPSGYTVANRKKQDVITHSTYLLHKESSSLDKSDNKENLSFLDTQPKRIKVCEGGYQSNEDYIYIRGRGFFPGRGKYVCEECGIRCKKPSMLKKHIRTHTDLRPYTCKHCAFSFKTKGNLTKHMKSKAHYKRCIELEIVPVPTSVDDCFFDDDGKVKQEGTVYSNGTNSEETEEETEEEEDDDDDEDDDTDDDVADGSLVIDRGSVKLEREAAKSLLSLSEVTLETAHKQYINAGLVPAFARPRTYPYSLMPTVEFPDKQSSFEKVEVVRSEDSWEREGVIVHSQSPKPSLVKPLSPKPPLNPPETSNPIDLSNKSSSNKLSVITSAGMPTPLIATMYSATVEKLSATTSSEEYTEDECKLLHAYLTERAVRDTHMKRHQVHEGIKKQQEAAAVLQKQQEQHLQDRDPISPLPSESPPLTPPLPGPPGPQELTDSPALPEKQVETGSVPALPSSNQPSVKSPAKKTPKAEFMPPSSAPNLTYISSTEDGRSMCGVCNKVFNKPSQLRLHINIHYFERPFRCESCAVSFRTKGHLQKHQRSLSHLNKVNMNSTFGTATSSNPRPFKCDDCKIAFRIHGHLAKHLRSKMHIMKLECLEKLPFGTYAELERSGINMNDIDTTDCENSLESLQILAQKLCEKDPSKLSDWEMPCRSGPIPEGASGEAGDSSEGEEVEGVMTATCLPPPDPPPPPHKNAVR